MNDIKLSQKDHAFRLLNHRVEDCKVSESETYTLEGHTFKVKDKRPLGFYCLYCKRFSEKAEMDERGLKLTPDDKEDGSTLVFKRDTESLMPKTKEVWRVFLHYCGCRGWN